MRGGACPIGEPGWLGRTSIGRARNRRLQDGEGDGGAPLHGLARAGVLTHRQIAAAAHISERTVETHVQHVLAKLGFTGRSQIAAWVARRGDAGAP
ncbi:response regulator transcription factor [Pseudonocardia pini]|uniref:response regulator transcription factor n=1 Tax=Pseudonocardia pini TaxID=2758030 RepID=UPI0028AA0E99|nr:helix-turn-helix transcriptional regulator [Pseudonocardia pini]